MSFANLGLSPPTLQAVEEAGYSEPTPIQKQAIPSVLIGRDVLGIAQTGTGKTAGFTLPMIDVLSEGRSRARMPRSLILEPTRELAAQVADSFEVYGKYHKLSMALLIGGVSFSDQNRVLDRGADVLIATPGRLLDHVERGKLMLTGVKILVIDEADRMLDMGFIPDVERICKLIPQKHQTLFFSATMPGEIKRLVDRFLDDPKQIEVAPPASPAETVEQFLVSTTARDKTKKLRSLLESEEVGNAIVFCNRKKDVDLLNRALMKHGENSAALHGDMDQGSRMEVLAKFKAGDLKLLIASDVAARGLDIPRVSHVFNFDVPIHAEDYIHRIGRTGRAGRSGRAFMLTTSDDAKALRAIQHMLGGDIPVYGAPSGNEASVAAPAAPKAKTETKAEPKTGPKTGPKTETKTEPKTEAKTEPKTEKKPAEPDEKPKSSRSQNRKKQAPRSGRANKEAPETAKAERERSEPVVGLGEHVPAFLAREAAPKKPVRSRKPSKAAS